MEALQAIAEANGGNRLAGFPGHDAPAAYVKQRLEAAGYEASYHDFTYNYTGAAHRAGPEHRRRPVLRLRLPVPGPDQPRSGRQGRQGGADRGRPQGPEPRRRERLD